MRNIKKFVFGNKIKFVLATLLVLYLLFFTNLPIGFYNILYASNISGVDDNGNFLYKHQLNEDEISIDNDYSLNSNYEPADFETSIYKNISTFDLDDWKYILVNKENPLKEDIECDLIGLNGFDVDVRIYDKLTEMFDAAKEDGINLCMASGYRNYNTQKYLYEKKINYYKRLGYSTDEATQIASMKVTPPLTSEHETGLAVDILSYEYNTMDSDFGLSDAGKWLKKHSYEYGFILRYPQGKEDITMIQYEPWHFRYVGEEAAEFIYVNDLTFEEFYDMVSEYNGVDNEEQ
ncbi:MAG: M15 family metallopeptidase [Lachnospiraceae bacterium]|nr:M15 family metallopeptidase [Lachnospiraceae bacterium]